MNNEGYAAHQFIIYNEAYDRHTGRSSNTDITAVGYYKL